VRDRGRKNRLTGDEKCTKLSRGDTVGRTGDASPVSPAVATPLFRSQASGLKASLSHYIGIPLACSVSPDHENKIWIWIE